MHTGSDGEATETWANNERVVTHEGHVTTVVEQKAAKLSMGEEAKGRRSTVHQVTPGWNKLGIDAEAT